MKSSGRKSGFSLIELLVVVGIISTLSVILLPSLGGAKEGAYSVSCLNNLRNLGFSMKMYHSDNQGEFWPFALYNTPRAGVHAYFWGTNTDPVDTRPSPFMQYCDNLLASFWCPKQQWGSYVPQGGVSEPTTNYGYNAACLAGFGVPPKCESDLNNPGELFVFADSGMYWAPGSVRIFQNSSYLEPVTGSGAGWSQTPTSHFRHKDKTYALCADGHAGGFGLEGWIISGIYKDVDLGFVGTQNVPHYDQE